MGEPLTTEQFWAQHWESPNQHSARTTGYAARFWDNVYSRALHDVRKGQRFLEVGCGNSQHLPLLAQRYGLEVTGVDYTENGCAQAREWLARANVTGTILKRDLFAANADLRGQFDFVASFGLVEHFANPAESIALMKRFLKPGGRLITTVPNITPGSLLVRVQRIIGPRTLAAHRLMTLDDFRQFHESCGLRTTHCNFEGMGASLVCDEVTPRNRLLHAVTFRGMQVIRRTHELLGLPLPRWRFTSLMMFYIGSA
ncbi:MAG: Ubiquinone biosynthesis O-methyltransferase [Verrucomicrobiae bacterium]|nr:Ubiquinone biosynthesis O-methyltransferase [Verrucomicrobiae bacterium]